MDEETCRLLEEWGLSCLQEHFNENMIDLSTMKLLNEEDLRQLISPIGLMIKFREKWRCWKDTGNELLSSMCNTPVESEVVVSPSASCSGLVEEDIGSDISSLGGGDLLPLDFMLAIDADFVEKLLNSSLDGRGLLSAGAVTAGLLNEPQRKELGRLIIKNVIDRDPQSKIQSVTLSRLALQITKLFPKEVPSVYFSPSSPASNQTNKRKKNASGILYEVYVNRRRKLRELGLLHRKPRSRSVSTSAARSSVSPVSSGTPEVEEQLKWLNNNIEPWSDVESYWAQTVEARLRFLEEKGCVIDYFNKYPCLKHHQGYKLLLQDFDHLYPGKENILLNGITAYKNKILTIANQKEQQIRDKDRKRTVRHLITIASEASSSQSSVAVLLLLNHLLNIKIITKKPGKEQYKPSKSEIQDSFITFIPSETDILAVVNERKRKYERYGLTLQPFLIIVGTTEEIKQCRVIVDLVTYNFVSAIDGIDTVFKLIHATNACYQEEAEQVWLFIQKAFYGITTKFDYPTQTVRNLLADLEIK